MLLKDESVNVVKKAILTLTQLYKVTLQVKPKFKKTKEIDILDIFLEIFKVFHFCHSVLSVVGKFQSGVRAARGLLGSGDPDEG